MKTLLFFTWLFCTASVYAQNAVSNPALSRQLDSMMAEDQKWRMEFVKQMQGEKTEHDSAAIVTRMKQTDSLNQLAIRKILTANGYPGFNMVGNTSSEAFGAMVLHCDDDVALQEQALALLEREIKKKNASEKLFAFLTDRVLINKGKKQRYGTQTEMSADGTKFVAAPVADMKNVDNLRKKLGLPPLKDYLEQVNALYLKRQ